MFVSIDENKAFIRLQVEYVWNKNNRGAIAKYWDQDLSLEMECSHKMLLTIFPDRQLADGKIVATWAKGF